MMKMSNSKHLNLQCTKFGFLPILSCAPTFIISRLLQHTWFYWDRIRKKKLIWALMHTQLTIVVLVAFILVLLGAVIIVIQANQNYPAESLAESLTHLLFLTILPFFGIATLMTFTLLAVILPPAALASYLFSRRITQRLEGLAQSTSHLRDGDFDSRVTISGEDEIAQLQADFNAMANKLESTLEDLQTERDKVASLLDAQRQLTATVSHELRTPLATIQGYLEPTLEDWEGSPPETLQNDLRVVDQEIKRLERLINDLLSLSQAEMMTLTLNIQPIDTGNVIQRMVDTFSPLAWQRGRVEVVSHVGSRGQFAHADEGRLEQILANLLRNGIQHTPPGGIVVVDVSENDTHLVIEVRDTGEGIPEDEIAHIWERFYRGDNDNLKGKRGAGLGLALVKELTEAMGGSVSVESVLGEDSIFKILLPKA
jgi:signal transduction histidine kinase